MRFNSASRSGRLWRLTGLVAALAAIAAVVISATGASAKNDATGKTASSSTTGHWVDGTLLNGTLPKNGKAASGGTMTYGEITGQTPTDIDPIINGATCSTQTFEFVADQYVPLYYGPNGATPEINEGMSAAQAPKYSNGNKTVTITIKPGLKWSDGSPVNGEDVAFYYYVLKAATNESPSNWCQYASSTQFPYNVKSISYNGNTVVMNLTHSVNPTWFTNNQLQDTNGGVYPLPANDWNVNASGQHLTDWATNPADAKAIYDNLNKAGTDVSTFASSPLWSVVDGPFKLQSFNTTNSSYVLVPNKTYGLSPKPNFTFDANTYTSSTALLDAMKTGAVEIGNLDPGTQLAPDPGARTRRIQRLRRSRLGLVRRVLQLQGRHRPLQQDHRAAVYPRCVRAADRSVGHRRARLSRLGCAGLWAGRRGAEVAVRPQQRDQARVELQPEGGCRDAQGSRLERQAGWHDHLRERG